MTLLEKLETYFDPQIVFPDEIAREAYNEINRLRHALLRIKSNIPYNDRHNMMCIAKEALMQLPNVKKG